MVYKCFVTGCKSHKSPKNTTFGIPKDPDLRRKWEEALSPYSKGKVLQDKHRVCKAHFKPEEMEFYFVHLIQGTEVKIERGRPELKKGAIPSVFPGTRKLAWRKVLEKNLRESENTKQSILLRNGEWIHIKEPKNSVELSTKSNKRTKAKSSTTAAKHLSDHPESTKQKSSFQNSNEASDVQFQLLSGGNLNESGSVELPEPETGNVSNELSAPLHPMKPSDKEIPSICINWDALPLPEEIGILLCDTSVPPLNSSREIIIHPPVSHSPQGLPSPNFFITEIKSLPSVQEDIIIEQQSEEDVSISDNVADDQQQGEEILVLTFQELLSGISDVQLPSPMWASHTDHIRVFFSCMSYGSVGYTAVPKVEKVIMYQGLMQPRVFLRGIEVILPEMEENCTSLEDVEKLLCLVDKLKLCMGIDSIGDTVSYTANCDIFAESGRLPRCQSCKKQRSIEYNKKRHLENDGRSSLSQQPMKKRQPSFK